MSESGDGVSVAATRQNAGRSRNACSAPAGGEHAPAGGGEARGRDGEEFLGISGMQWEGFFGWIARHAEVASYEQPTISSPFAPWPRRPPSRSMFQARYAPTVRAPRSSRC